MRHIFRNVVRHQSGYLSDGRNRCGCYGMLPVSSLSFFLFECMPCFDWRWINSRLVAPPFVPIKVQQTEHLAFCSSTLSKYLHLFDLRGVTSSLALKIKQFDLAFELTSYKESPKTPCESWADPGIQKSRKTSLNPGICGIRTPSFTMQPFFCGTVVRSYLQLRAF